MKIFDKILEPSITVVALPTGASFEKVKMNGFEKIFELIAQPVPDFRGITNLMLIYRITAAALIPLLNKEDYSMARVWMNLHMTFGNRSARLIALFSIYHKACTEQPECQWAEHCVGPIEKIFRESHVLDTFVNPNFVHGLGLLGIKIKVMNMDDVRFKVSIIPYSQHIAF